MKGSAGLEEWGGDLMIDAKCRDGWDEAEEGFD